MKKKAISLLTCSTLTLSLISSAFAAPSDLNGHWAEDSMNTWINYGVIQGYEDGSVRPNNSITRGELAVMLDRMMGYQTQSANTFTDLGDSWYTDAILSANKAGIINGYANGTVKPSATISRQEAVVMIARALSLRDAAGASNVFTDSGEVASWALDAVNAMVDAGYIHGSNGAFRPEDGITRAEVVTILNNIFGGLYQASGTYTENIDGSLVVSNGDVSLEGITIKGDLIIAEGVSANSIVLDNVTVEGRIIVRGGGTGDNAMVIKGNSEASTIVVQRQDEAVEIEVQDGATVDEIVASTGTENVTVSGTVDTVIVDDANTAVEINGTVNNLTVTENAENADVTIPKDAKVGRMITEANNTNLSVAGTVNEVTVSEGADNATVSTESGAKIDNVTTSGAGTTVEGNGTVSKVEAAEGSTGASVTTPGTKVENNSTGSVDTGKGEVNPGDTGTTPGGSSSGGSSSGGSSHSHSYTDGVCSCGAYDPAWAQVNSAETWNAAAEAGKNIVVTADFTADAQLKISSAITVNGRNHIITAGSWEDPSEAKGDMPLVSVIAGNNAVVMKNIVLTGAQTSTQTTANGEIKDHGHGMNVYESSNVTLENVTLKDNAGAGLVVNSSSVTAAGLHTSGNGWGGVNVDEQTKIDAVFTFDAASTFAEALAVYSDNGGVTVTYPTTAGWIHLTGAYGKKDIWAKAFDNGSGTVDSPYEIATAAQFNNISALADDMKAGTPYYFLQTDDFTYANTITTFCGTYDGGNKTIFAPTDKNGFAVIFRDAYGTTVFKNLNIQSRANCGLSLYSNYTPAYESLTISNVYTSAVNNEIVSVNTNNFGFLIINYIGDDFTDTRDIQQLTTIENCTNAASLVNEGTCAGAFIGSGYNLSDAANTNHEKLVIRNCINSGNITAATFAGSISGNPSYLKNAYDLITEKTPANNFIDIQNVSNTGTISASSDVGVFGTSSGEFAEAYPNNSIGGTYEKVQTLSGKHTVYFDNASNTFSVQPETDNGYAYKVYLSVGTLYYDHDENLFGNSIRFPFDAATVSEEGTRLNTTKIHAYDLNTAKSMNIVTDETVLNYATYNGYEIALYSNGDTLYLILKNAEGKVDYVNSGVTAMLYAFNGDTYVGHTNINQQ